MIQIWVYGETSTKYAYFSGGVARFATLDSDASVDTVREALLASGDVRTDIKPRADKSILWHDDDRATIAAWYSSQLDGAQTEVLLKLVGGDIGRVLVYILKRLELFSMQLSLANIGDTPILYHEAGDGLLAKQELASEWAKKGNVWLDAVGRSEWALREAKRAIAACDNDADMRAIVEEFPAVLSEVLQ